MSLTAEEVVSKYIALRDKRSALKKAFDLEDSKYKELQDMCEGWLLKQCNLLGADTLAIRGVGTAIRSRQLKASCKDWKAFDKFVLETGSTDLYERRIARKNLETFIETHNGDIPPGVDVIYEQVITVRRATTKGEAE
jgi:hypothetical protein